MNVLDTVFATVYDRMTAPMERSGLAERRQQLLSDLSGSVLEVGAGTGRNLESYPDAVTSLTLTEPSGPMLTKLRAHVTKVRPDAEVIEASAEDLPFEAASFDAVVTTLVLCSVDNLDKAVHELRRVIRSDGRLVVVEHVAASGGPSLPQRMWEPAQKVLGRNCHLTRDTRRALEAGGFDTGGVVDATLPGGPALMFPAILGIALPVLPPAGD